jgi:hypothetical protein
MKTIFVILSLLAGVTCSIATPIAPTKPLNLKGEVVSFVWIDQTYFEGDGERIRLRSATTGPTYIVILRTSSVDAKTRQSLTSMIRYPGTGSLKHMITSLEIKEDEMLVLFSSPKRPALKPGSKLELDDYSLSGDEWGIGAAFSAIRIDGKLQANQKAEQAVPPNGP